MTDHTSYIKPWLRVVAIVLLAITTVSFFAVSFGDDSAVEALSKRGSTGTEVRQIQTKLKNWGYYNGNVDGIYGSQTENAVKYFQRKNGLTVDGIAGPQTLAAMGISSSSSSSNSDYYLLARIISAEARGESYVGQVAVGAVVLNRVEHPSFPNSVSGVVYQPGAFTAINDGQINQPIANSAYQAARDALNGWDPSGGALYYYNPAKTNNAWIRTRPVITTIGNHVFAK
ncbi:MAG: spore cortex-lytic enzyme [Oscillospiraceae bacterium]|nr:spore cortex-lytic enzyme [Oscillospiraceae bacterium]MBQ9939110.1 spore cortex-lytic enzyme [Oscillospiraceae bacterium]